MLVDTCVCARACACVCACACARACACVYVCVQAMSESTHRGHVANHDGEQFEGQAARGCAGRRKHVECQGKAHVQH